MTSEQTVTETTSTQTIPVVTEELGIAENFVNELIEAGYDNDAFSGILGPQADIDNLPPSILDDVAEVLEYSASEADICEDETFLSDFEITESDRECLREWGELCSRTESLLPALQEIKETSPNFVSFFEKWNRIACYGNVMLEYVDSINNFNSECFEVMSGEANEDCVTDDFESFCEKTEIVLDATRLIQTDGLAEIADGDIVSLELAEQIICNIVEEIENLEAS